MVSAPVWASRTGSDLEGRFADYSETTHDDGAFLVHDLMGSIAHVMGLRQAGLLTPADARSLVAALQDIHQAWLDGSFRLDASLEDGHMNIENHVTAALGDVGKRIHTGRSRNDQVATCIALYGREALLELAKACQGVAQALAQQAARHHDTPWVARTHGQPAQPATLGFLLMAHVFRFQDLAKTSLQAFEDIGESPLGAGAVAGSTLPLEPAYTADLLGLRPLRNALLATGSRDHVLKALQAVSQAGLLASSAAQDLLDLFGHGALKLKSQHTTGSSLMPQKRNPDALELVRGHAKALIQSHSQALSIVTGIGLGYQRDFQRTKPMMAAALQDGIATLHMLQEVIQGATFDVAALQKSLTAPGITATDAAEALVAAGMPFRNAYQALASAHKAAERGIPIDEALQHQGLPMDALQAALAALVPDPARRNTVGGPAPQQVRAMVTGFEAAAHALSQAFAAADDAVAKPAKLLHMAPEAIQ